MEYWNIDSAEKSSVHPSTGLRANGRLVEVIEVFSDHAELVEAFFGSFSRIEY